MQTRVHFLQFQQVLFELYALGNEDAKQSGCL